MRATAIGALAIGLFGLASPALAAPPDPPAPELPADDALPSYDDAPIAPIDPSFDGATFGGTPIEDEEPPSGRGRTVVGSILLGGGTILTGMSIAMIILEIDRPAWIPGAALGGVAMATGAILVGTGFYRHQTYREWADRQSDGPVPSRGRGWLAGGLTCIIGGSAGIIIGSVSLAAYQNGDDLPYGEVMVPLGVTSALVGGLLLVGAIIQGKHYARWHAARVAPSFSLLPSTRPGFAGGLSVGVAGRF